MRRMKRGQPSSRSNLPSSSSPRTRKSMFGDLTKVLSNLNVRRGIKPIKVGKKNAKSLELIKTYVYCPCQYIANAANLILA